MNRVPDTTDSDVRFEKYVLPEVEVMLRVARSITRNQHDAEDLVQDALLRAYKAIDRFDGRHPRAWLLTILRNAEINRHRRRRPELLRDPDAVDREPAAGGAPSAEEVALTGTFDAEVEQAFEALPHDFRSVVELVDMAGLSYAEAAEILDVPQGTVMSRLHRARRRIRDQVSSTHAPAGRIS